MIVNCRRFRIRKLAILGCFVTLAGCCSGPGESLTANQITTRGLTVVDELGRPRMRIRAVEGEVSMELLTKEGHPRLQVSLDKAELPAIYFLSEPFGRTLELFETYDGFIMRSGKTFSLLASDDKGSGLIMRAPSGDARVTIGSEGEGPGSLKIRDENGRAVFVAPK